MANQTKRKPVASKMTPAQKAYQNILEKKIEVLDACRLTDSEACKGRVNNGPSNATIQAQNEALQALKDFKKEMETPLANRN